MPRQKNRLTPVEVKNASGPGYYPDGDGLQLQISASGAKSWVYRFTIAGRQRDMGLGPLEDVTLAKARAQRDEAKALLRKGIDPIEQRKSEKSANLLRYAAGKTFAECAGDFIRQHRSAWSNPKHAAQWATTLENYAFPRIGKLSVQTIETPHIISILEPLWATRTETASRLRGRIENILDWATVRGYRKGENPARWRGHLDKLLPARAKVQKTEHHPALDYRQMGEFMAALRQTQGMGARALEFAILTAARSGEVRGATWSEIDQDARLWRIPANRMKAGQEHIVPLSDEIFKLLKSLPRFAGTDLIFPSTLGGVLSDMTLTSVIRRMDEARGHSGGAGWRDRTGKTITAHGFRSSFRDWAGETTAFPREVIEHALAHRLADKAEAAYQRGTLLDKRRRLMAEWSGYCELIYDAAQVVPLRGSAA